MQNAECRMLNVKNECGVRNDDLKDRTKKFALNIIKFVENLPKNNIAGTIGKQLLRSGTSVGANYRAACKARSRADFIAKMGIVEEESDETSCWLELLLDSQIVNNDQVQYLLKESNEITAIVVTSIKTARRNSAIRIPQSAFRTPHSAL